jgi:hypothetical protein
MITIKKLQIFDSYGGLIDGLLTVGKKEERELFNNSDWSVISSFYQDIELIRKGRAAQSYIDKVISTMNEYCDKDSFEVLTSRMRS